MMMISRSSPLDANCEGIRDNKDNGTSTAKNKRKRRRIEMEMEMEMEKGNKCQAILSTSSSSTCTSSSSSNLNFALLGKSKYKLRTFQDLVKFVNDLASSEKTWPQESDESRLLAAKPAIDALRRMVGLVHVKDLLKQIIVFCAQVGGSSEGRNNVAMKSPCLMGGPGMGKTTLAKIIADLYWHTGILRHTAQNQQVRYIEGNRSNMIGMYLGHSAKQTQDIIDRCRIEQKVLWIDEVHQLGHEGKRDSYSKEAIDTLCLNITRHTDFHLILGGYQQDIIDCFLSVNKGLSRRFRFVEMDKDEYSAKHLRLIFFQQLLQAKCDVTDPITVATEKWFEKHRAEFPFMGGDVETLCSEACISHFDRILGCHPLLKRKLNLEDMENGLKKLQESRAKTGDHNSENPYVTSMYV